MRLVHVLCLLGSVSIPVSLAARQDHHGSGDQRGAMVMGFDQARTTHHFLLFSDGGAIDVSVNDSADTKNRDAIRTHLPHIAMMFGEGNFDAPMLVHDSKNVPGTKAMTERKETIRYQVRGDGKRRPSDYRDIRCEGARGRARVLEVSDRGAQDGRSDNRADAMTGTPMGPRDVARTTGVSTDTLRHYERKGLLPGVTRTAAGYRRYSAATVERVLLIQRALVVGFSLADLKRVLGVRDRGGAPCQSVRSLVGERLDELNQRIEELLTLRDELRLLLGEWDGRLSKTAKGQRANLLETLGTRAVIEGTRRRRQTQSAGADVRAITTQSLGRYAPRRERRR